MEIVEVLVSPFLGGFCSSFMLDKRMKWYVFVYDAIQSVPVLLNRIKEGTRSTIEVVHASSKVSGTERLYLSSASGNGTTLFTGERLYSHRNGFIYLPQLLNNNKLGNWQWLFCAQHLRNVQPVEKIKLGTREVSFRFEIILTDNKVGNSIDESDMQETFLPSSDLLISKEKYEWSHYRCSNLERILHIASTGTREVRVNDLSTGSQV